MTVFDYIRYVCFVIKENFTTCFGLLKSRSRHRTTSVLFLDREDDEGVNNLYKDAILLARPATEPSDILWKNMRGNRGLFLLRRMALFILGLLIIIFISSPTVLFANIKAVDKTHFWDFDWVQDLPAGNLMKNHAAPSIIILINLLLLVIIDWACILESYETHSLYQEAVYTKSVIYLILNMLVIPALTLNGSQDDVH